jgi:hypothetical protein
MTKQDYKKTFTLAIDVMLRTDLHDRLFKVKTLTRPIQLSSRQSLSCVAQEVQLYHTTKSIWPACIRICSYAHHDQRVIKAAGCLKRAIQ